MSSPNDNDDSPRDDADVGGGDEELVPEQALDVRLVHQRPRAHRQHGQASQLLKNSTISRKLDFIIKNRIWLLLFSKFKFVPAKFYGKNTISKQ